MSRKKKKKKRWRETKNKIRDRKCFASREYTAAANANLQKAGNERSAWPRFPSPMMTRRNELTGSSLILFWQISSLSSASTSNECNLPRCFLPSNNGERTRNEPVLLYLRIRKWKEKMGMTAKDPVAVPFCEIEGCVYLGRSYIGKVMHLLLDRAAFIPPACAPIRSS